MAEPEPEPEPRLPPEMVEEILCRLPSKPLLRFLTVSTTWLSLITDPYFISLHRRRSASSFFLLEFECKLPGCQLHRSLHRNDPLFTPSDNSLRFPFIQIPHLTNHLSYVTSIASICHGLLCITTWVPAEAQIYLTICNPSIRRLLFLPKPQPIPLPLRDYAFVIALGFDSQNHDYKIVKIFYGNPCVHHGPLGDRVEVYSLASGRWRGLPLPLLVAPPFIISGRNSHGFVHGRVHWGAKRMLPKEGYPYHHFVLSFDFVDEVFREVLLPECLSRASSHWVTVSVIGCRNNEEALTVCHLVRNLPHAGSIWVMKEYGVVESWTKLFTFDFTFSRLEAGLFVVMLPPTALFVKNNREILLPLYDHEQKNGHLCLLDVENNQFVDLQIGPNNYNWWRLVVRYYAESLVLLNHPGNLVSY